jgi:hypothetical protein
VNAIASLLQRVKAAEDWPPGLRVVRDLGLEPLEGRVAFVEDGWVYWAANDRHVHASRPDALKRST